MMTAAAPSPIAKIAAKTIANAGVKYDATDVSRTARVSGARVAPASAAGAVTGVPQPTQNLAPAITGIPHCGQNRITIASTLLGFGLALGPAIVARAPRVRTHVGGWPPRKNHSRDHQRNHAGARRAPRVDASRVDAPGAVAPGNACA